MDVVYKVVSRELRCVHAVWEQQLSDYYIVLLEISKQRDFFRSCLDGKESELCRLIETSISPAQKGKYNYDLLLADEDPLVCLDKVAELLESARKNFLSYKDIQASLMLKTATSVIESEDVAVDIKFNFDFRVLENHVKALMDPKDSKGSISFPE
jgi:hypothetical protein